MLGRTARRMVLSFPEIHCFSKQAVGFVDELADRATAWGDGVGSDLTIDTS
jgi:hypothetical protein